MNFLNYDLIYFSEFYFIKQISFTKKKKRKKDSLEIMEFYVMKCEIMVRFDALLLAIMGKSRFT